MTVSRVAFICPKLSAFGILFVGGEAEAIYGKIGRVQLFWSLRLPRLWVGEVSVCVGDAQYVWQSLRLARNTRASCVRSWCTVWSGRRCGGCLYFFFVYLDDILIVGTRRFVRKAVRHPRQRL